MNKHNLPSTRLASQLLVICAVCLLVSFAMASRFWLLDWPNFKPVGAVAIFLGYWMRRLDVSALAVVIIMFVSDFWIGFYDIRLMLAVYGSMVLACAIGFVAKPQLDSSESLLSESLKIVAASLIAAIAFFFVTNSAVWLLGNGYAPNLSGWIAALIAGIPFFKFTVCGNALFTLLLFSTYRLIESSRFASSKKVASAAK
ncbi:MAG: DUF6580 family putative transport protein [Planctomycetota bacterium]